MDPRVKAALFEGYSQEIDRLTTVEVKPDMLKMQNFEHRIESYVE